MQPTGLTLRRVWVREECCGQDPRGKDHQRKNAMALVVKDAAIMVLDSDAREKLGTTIVNLLHDGETRMRLQRNVAEMALPGADEKIVDIILARIADKN